jgi:7-cyano-7-deazaguanine synthase
MENEMKSKPKAVVIFSGGMDSATLLDWAIERYDVTAISFNYGQKHRKELLFAQTYCLTRGVPQKVVQIDPTLLYGSALTSDVEMPHGAFDDEVMKLTVVPNRNMIMLSQAVGYALSIGAEVVLYGAHAGDHTIYPDCRPEFLDAMNEAVNLCDWKQTRIEAPFLKMTKGEIVVEGLQLGTDYHRTWTCYEGGEKPCGKCGSCDERAEAFAFAKTPDPYFEGE